MMISGTRLQKFFGVNHGKEHLIRLSFDRITGDKTQQSVLLLCNTNFLVLTRLEAVQNTIRQIDIEKTNAYRSCHGFHTEPLFPKNQEQHTYVHIVSHGSNRNIAPT